MARHSMVLRAAEPIRSAQSSHAEPKIRRKSLARKLPSLFAAIAVIVFIGVLRLVYAISEAADMMRIIGVDCDLRRYEQRSNSTQCPLSTKVFTGSSSAWTRNSI